MTLPHFLLVILFLKHCSGVDEIVMVDPYMKAQLYLSNHFPPTHGLIPSTIYKDSIFSYPSGGQELRTPFGDSYNSSNSMTAYAQLRGFIEHLLARDTFYAEEYSTLCSTKDTRTLYGYFIQQQYYIRGLPHTIPTAQTCKSWAGFKILERIEYTHNPNQPFTALLNISKEGKKLEENSRVHTHPVSAYTANHIYNQFEMTPYLFSFHKMSDGGVSVIPPKVPPFRATYMWTTIEAGQSSGLMGFPEMVRNELPFVYNVDTFVPEETGKEKKEKTEMGEYEEFREELKKRPDQLESYKRRTGVFAFNLTKEISKTEVNFDFGKYSELQLMMQSDPYRYDGIPIHSTIWQQFAEEKKVLSKLFNISGLDKLFYQESLADGDENKDVCEDVPYEVISVNSDRSTVLIEQGRPYKLVINKEKYPESTLVEWKTESREFEVMSTNIDCIQLERPTIHINKRDLLIPIMTKLLTRQSIMATFGSESLTVFFQRKRNAQSASEIFVVLVIWSIMFIAFVIVLIGFVCVVRKMQQQTNHDGLKQMVGEGEALKTVVAPPPQVIDQNKWTT